METFIDPEAFAYRDDVRLRWLQRILLWGLRKIGAHRQSRTETVKRETFDAQDLFNAVFEAQKEVFEYRTPTKIYIGRSNFEEILDLPPEQAMGIYSFDMAAKYGLSGRPMLCNLPVTVLPYMRGILVV